GHGGTARERRCYGESVPALHINVLLQAMSSTTPPDDWADAVRSAQLTGAVERSLRRGRVISLEFDEHTEDSTFKGIMTSVGCMTLLLIPVLAVLLSAVAPSQSSFGNDS